MYEIIYNHIWEVHEARTATQIATIRNLYRALKSYELELIDNAARVGMLDVDITDDLIHETTTAATGKCEVSIKNASFEDFVGEMKLDEDNIIDLSEYVGRGRTIVKVSDPYGIVDSAEIEVTL